MAERTSLLKRRQIREGPPLSLAEAAKPSGTAGTSAKIVSQDAAGVTLELVCECGRRTYVRCEYATAAPAAARQAIPRAVEPARPGGGA